MSVTTGVSAPILLTGILCAVEVSLLVPLLLPWPIALRRKVVQAVLESRLVAQALWGIKLTLIFITIMLVDSGNQIYKLEMSRRAVNDPDMDVPISPEIGATTDRAAKKLVAERNGAVALATLFMYFALWRTFAREIELHKLHEKIAKLEGAPDAGDSSIEASVLKHQHLADQEAERRKPVPKGMDGNAVAAESQL